MQANWELMIIYVVAFPIWLFKKYFEVQLQSIFNLDDYVFTWCDIMQQSSMRKVHQVKDHAVYVYWIDTVYVQIINQLNLVKG